ncbi:MAG: Lrp/AsnC family transcriptional regulator, partial [Gammaproteobacteria bacterium]
MLELDRLDKKILNLLQEDNQINNTELADKVGLSPPACLKRVKKLREQGIIMHDVSVIDPFKLGSHLVVFVNITLEKQREDLLSHFEHKMRLHPELKLPTA